MDIPLGGSQFTWSNNISRSRIYRFLVSTDWENHFLYITQQMWPRLLSDHYLLLLVCGNFRR